MIGRRAAIASRVAWELANGPIPRGACVLHSCDNRPCCNPAHLFLGTKADNAADCKAKGRNARGSRSGHAKLDERDIAVIVGRVRDGEHRTDVARDYGVSNQLVSRICLRQIWTHVDVKP